MPGENFRKMFKENIFLKDYTYNLPEDKIAKFPLEIRDNSKLLIYGRNGKIQEGLFHNIADYLPDKSFLIFNDTKVINARLIFHKDTGAQIEIFCLEPVDNDNINQQGACRWKCFAGNLKKWKDSGLIRTKNHDQESYEITAKKIERKEDYIIVEFSWTPRNKSFYDILEVFGEVPLPPYIKRKPVISDSIRYQTIYARNCGSVAAPTAGLHFTEKVFDSVKRKGIICENLTLHVGAGTFKPVSSENVFSHGMHTEHLVVNKDVLINIYNNLDRTIISVGTTTVRVLESLYWFGVNLLLKPAEVKKMEISQWEYLDRIPAGRNIDRKSAIHAIIDFMEKEGLQNIYGSTKIMIVPGYSFNIADAVITNFHQPESTLLLLVASFIGDSWKTVYQYALLNNFRFLSYGDCCLFFR